MSGCGCGEGVGVGGGTQVHTEEHPLRIHDCEKF